MQHGRVQESREGRVRHAGGRNRPLKDETLQRVVGGHGIATRVPSAQTNTLKKILKAEHRLLRVCLLVTLSEENSRKEKRVPAAGASSGGGRPMRQPTLVTGSKRPFGSL